MRELDKKEAPEISGGYFGPLVTDPPAYPTSDYPDQPMTGTGEEDLPAGSGQND